MSRVDDIIKEEFLNTLERFGIYKRPKFSLPDLIKDTHKRILEQCSNSHDEILLNPKQFEQFKGLAEQLKCNKD